MLLIFCGCGALVLNSQCSVTTCNASHVDRERPRIAAPGTSTTKNFVFLHSRPVIGTVDIDSAAACNTSSVVCCQNAFCWF